VPVVREAKAHELNVYSRWHDGEIEHEIVAMVVENGRMRFRVREGDEIMDRGLPEVAASYISAMVMAGPELLDYADADLLFSDLTAEEIHGLRVKESYILKVISGPKQGIGQRWEYSAAGVGVSVSQLRRKAERYLDQGLIGLLHQNRRVKGASLDEFHPDTVAVVKATLAEHTGASKVDAVNLRAIARANIRDAHVPEPSYEKLKQLVDLLNAGHSAFGSAKTRESVANRPVTGGYRTRALFFGDEVEIDSMMCNLLIWDLQGKEVRPWVVVAVDVATKRFWVRVVPGHPSGRDVALLLHDMINPLPLEPMARPWLDVVCLPRTVGVNAEPEFTTPTADLGVEPGIIRMDHGTEGENLLFISILAQLGIDIEWARSMSPTDKAFVESRNNDLARFIQLLPAHVGNSPENRGRNASTSARLTLWELQLLMDEWVHLSMFVPHRGLPDPTTPGKFWTPMQAFNMSVTNRAPLRVTPHVNLVYEFLPIERAIASDDAVSIGGVDYTCPELPQLTALSKGDAKRAGRKLTFHVDPYDRTRIFWHAPGTMQWHVLRAKSPTGEVVPAFSEVLRQRMIDAKSSPRWTPAVTEEVRTLLSQYIRGFIKARGPDSDFGLAVNQLLAAVRDPLPEPSPLLTAAGADPELLIDEEFGDEDDLEALMITEEDLDAEAW
jgi:hypothetical protein